MRMLWFIPHGVRVVGPERYTRYWGGFCSTLNPITRRQAAAVVAKERRRARELVSLLEGLGFVAVEEGSESWGATRQVGEGFNRFDRANNGRYLHVTGRFVGLPGSFDEVVERFSGMPRRVVFDTSVMAHVRGRELAVQLPDRYGQSARITVKQRKESPETTAQLLVSSGSFFYGWDNHDPLWRVMLHGRSENGNEKRERERKRLGFGRQAWAVHSTPPGGMRKVEALRRIRLYLVGAGVDIERMRLTARRDDGGWGVGIGGSPVESLRALWIGDDGTIRVGGETQGG
ncbi:hypothetical protein [Nocardia sp. NPDC004722]